MKKMEKCLREREKISCSHFFGRNSLKIEKKKHRLQPLERIDFRQMEKYRVNEHFAMLSISK